MTALESMSLPFRLQHIQHDRFAKQHAYQLFHLSLTLSGNIAVSGFNYVTQQTFIDLYFRRNCNSKHKLTLVYSKEFPKYLDYCRFVSFLDSNGSQMLTCIGDKIEIFDSKNQSEVVRSCTVKSKIRCLAFTEGLIFIGSYKSQTVLVFNKDLKETNTITLKGLKESDFPRDLQVIKETVFVCTGHGRALSVGVFDGSILTEYRDTTGKYRRARSISVSERLGLVAVLWGMQRIILYFLSKNKACLLFDVDFGVHRIIISDRDRMMITGNISTGDIKMCNLEQLFSFEAMKKTFANIVLPNECEELRKYFGVTEEELSRKEGDHKDKQEKLNEKETVQRVKCLLTILEEKGYLDTYNIRPLMDAVATISDERRNFTLQGPMEGYVLYGILNLKVKCEALLMEITNRQNWDWDVERYQLSDELRAAKTPVNEYTKTVEAQDGELRRSQSQCTEHDQTLTSQPEQTNQLHNLNRTESAKKDKFKEKYLLDSQRAGDEGSSKCGGTEKSPPSSRHLVTKDQVNKNIHLALSDQSVQTIISSSCVSSADHVTTLTKEGYTEHDVVAALDISKNRLDLARKVLLLLGAKLDVLPKEDSIFLYKEQYVDENGGSLDLPEANVQMVIPAGAVSKGSIVNLAMMASTQDPTPSEGNTLRLTPVIKCGQEGLTLNKPVIVRIPHCASEIDGVTSTDMNLGFSNNGDVGIHWRKRKQNEPAPILKEDHLELLIQTFCAVSLDIAADFDEPLTKRLRVIPLIKKVVNPSDDLIVTVWIYNDDETEHMHLLHEEIDEGGKIQLHDFKRFTIKGLEDDKEVHIKRVNNNITPYPNASMKKVLSSTMWNNTRQSVEFNFQRKEGISDISFKIRLCKKQFLRRMDDLQFDVKVTLSELLKQHQTSANVVFKIQEPAAATMKSFHVLVSKLSGQLNMNSCLEIARLFGLNPDIRAEMKKSREPAMFLFDELKKQHLFTPACVSALDIALTNTGNEQLAEHVKEYRKRNPAFPTTIFRLL